MTKGYSQFKEFINKVHYNIDPDINIKKIEDEVIGDIPEQTLPNQFYYVVNNHTRTIVHVSDRITELTGYSPEEWTYEHILDCIHPDDKPFVDKSLYACFRLSMSPVINRPVTDALVLNYRMRHKQGHYIHILRHGYCTSMDRDNRMIHNTSMCMVITDFKHDNRQTMMLKEGNKILVELYSDCPDNIRWDLLSAREQQIVELLCDSKTSEEIG